MTKGLKIPNNLLDLGNLPVSLNNLLNFVSVKNSDLLVVAAQASKSSITPLSAPLFSTSNYISQPPNGNFVSGNSVNILNTGLVPTGLSTSSQYVVINSNSKNFQLALASAPNTPVTFSLSAPSGNVNISRDESVSTLDILKLDGISLPFSDRTAFSRSYSSVNQGLEEIEMNLFRVNFGVQNKIYSNRLPSSVINGDVVFSGKVTLQDPSDINTYGTGLYIRGIRAFSTTDNPWSSASVPTYGAGSVEFGQLILSNGLKLSLSSPSTISNTPISNSSLNRKFKVINGEDFYWVYLYQP